MKTFVYVYFYLYKVPPVGAIFLVIVDCIATFGYCSSDAAT